MLEQPPHCDQRVLHGPNDGCEFCNRHPEWQALREAWGIAFSGHKPKKIHVYGDNYNLELPCPADYNRPPGSSSDHRRWGGNVAQTSRHDSFLDLGRVVK